MRIPGRPYLLLSFPAFFFWACGSVDQPAESFEIGLDLYRRAAYDSTLVWIDEQFETTNGRLERARLLTLAGYVHYQRGAWDTAVALADLALDTLGSDGFVDQRGWTYNLLGLVAYQESRFDDALDMLEQVEAAGEQGTGDGALANQARAALNYALVYEDLGQFGRARREFERGLSISRKRGSQRLEAQGLSDLGSLLVRMGLPRQAQMLFAQARQIFEDIGARNFEANTLGQLGLALLEMGEFTAAVAVLDTAVAVAREFGLKQEEASNLAAAAEAQLRLGNHRRALRLFDEVDDITAELGLSYETATNLRSRAAIYRALGEFALARDAADRATILHDSLGATWDGFFDRLLAVEVMIDDGQLHEISGPIAELERVVALEANRSMRVALGLTKARAALEAGAVDRSLTVLRDIRSELEDGLPRWRIRAETLASEAWSLKNQVDSAIAAAGRAVTAVEHAAAGLTDAMSKLGAMGERVKPYEMLMLAHLRGGDTAQAFVAADGAKGRYLFEHRARTAAADPNRQDRLAITTRLDQMREVAMELEARPAAEVDSAWLNSVRAEVAQNQQALARIDVAEDNTDRVPVERDVVVTLQDVQAALGTDEVLVEFFVGDDEAIVFAVTTDHVIARSLDVAGDQLFQRVRAARDHLDRPGRNPEIRQEILQGLYEVLLSPVQTQLQSAKTVIVVPHAILAYLPIGTLISPNGERYLIEDMAVLTLPSAAALVALRRFLRRSDKTAEGRSVALAPLERELPATGDEVRAFGKLIDGALVLRGRRATKERAVQALEEAPIVHIATHVELRAAAPMSSYLRFGPTPNETSVLALHEIVDLDVRSQLVFLSGCETAVGVAGSFRYASGEDYATLAQTFLYAGAGNVIATLWRIDDVRSADFATRFYEHLQSGIGLIEALAQTQVLALHEPATADPYYWAPYQLLGSGFLTIPEDRGGGDNNSNGIR